MTYTPYQTANNFTSTVAGGAGGVGTPLSSGDTTLHLPTGDGAALPATGFIMLEVGTSERIKVTLRSGDDLTIVRGQDDTGAATWPVGTTIQAVISAQPLNDGWEELATLDSAKANLSGATFTGAVTTTSSVTAATTYSFSGAGGAGQVSIDTVNHFLNLWTPAPAGTAYHIDFHPWDGTSSNLATLHLDSSGFVEVYHNLRVDGSVTVGQSGSAPSVASSGTISTANLGTSRVTTAGAVTGVIMAAGTIAGQTVIVVNESGNSITMAAAATSNVADGVSCVIAANRAMWFVWDSSTSRWYHN